MNGKEIRSKIEKFTDDKLLRIYNNMKEDDEADLEVFFAIVEEKEKRGI